MAGRINSIHCNSFRFVIIQVSGLNWDESVHYNDPRNDCGIMEASMDWIISVINKPMMEEPGSRFNYNCGATELLAHIFKVATGRDIE